MTRKKFTSLDLSNRCINLADYPPEQKLFQGEFTSVVQLQPGIVVKSKPSCDLTEEIIAMRFAQAHVSLPVPKVLHHPPLPRRLASRILGSYPAVLHFCMEECKGTSLNKVIETMSPSQLDHIADQLSQILRRMAQTKSRRLGSVTGGPYHNTFFPDQFHPKHAFESVGEFLNNYRDMLNLVYTAEYTDTILSALPRNAPITFTHGDLLPKNIMVDGSTITGIIDWELAGFYPSYWEYCRMHDPSYMTPGWDYILRRIYPGERRTAEIDSIGTIIVSVLWQF